MTDYMLVKFAIAGCSFAISLDSFRAGKAIWGS